VAKFSSARVGVGEGARRGLQPGDVRSPLRRAAAGEGAEAHDLQPGEVFGAYRRGQRRGGLELYQLRAALGATEQLSGIFWGIWLGRCTNVGMRFRGRVPRKAHLCSCHNPTPCILYGSLPPVAHNLPLELYVLRAPFTCYFGKRSRTLCTAHSAHSG